MDILEEVIKYLDQSNFDDFTKIRWIYLYVCEKFSYDIRYPYALPNLKNEIYHKTVDLTNVEEFEHVCYAYAHILTDLLSLYGFECEIVKEKEIKNRSHVYVIVKYKDKLLKLDPTKKHDTTRVKMKRGTLDFQTLKDDPTFIDELTEADLAIQEYQKTDTSDKYEYKEIMKLISSMEDNFYKNNIPEADRFFQKLKVVFDIVNAKKDFTRYDDIDYYFSYLLKKFKLNETHPVYVMPAVFFKKDDPQMKDPITIILVKYKDTPTLFYILEKVDDHYQIRESDKKEIEEKLEEYENWLVDAFFKEQVKLADPTIKIK